MHRNDGFECKGVRAHGLSSVYALFSLLAYECVQQLNYPCGLAADSVRIDGCSQLFEGESKYARKNHFGGPVLLFARVLLLRLALHLDHGLDDVKISWGTSPSLQGANYIAA